MKILGIETSCDETAAAVVEDGTKVLSSVIASSQEMHIKTGGIIPEVAARQQIKSIIPVIDKAISKVKKENIDAIAVTYGPGLIGSLLVGIETAKTLSYLWNKPLIPVNHLVAHIYANWIGNSKLPEFPAIALVVSGGHTDFVYMKSHKNIKWIGGTRDDAAGEAFDKTARILGLPYPGGPSISKEAEKYFLSSRNENKLNLFPRPMIDSPDLDMSFSGLKTSVLNYTKQHSNFVVSQIAAEIQEAIIDTLVAKSLKAIENFKPKSFLLAGGVSANERLREKNIEKLIGKVEVFIPEPKYSTDNAAMIATCAFFRNTVVPWQKINAIPSLAIED